MGSHRIVTIALLLAGFAPRAAHADGAIGCTGGWPGQIGLSSRLGSVVFGFAKGEEHMHYSLQFVQDLQAPDEPGVDRTFYAGIGCSVAQPTEDRGQSYFAAHVPIGVLVRPGPEVELFAEWDPAIHIREEASYSLKGFTFGLRVVAWGRKARSEPASVVGAASDAPNRLEAPPLGPCGGELDHGRGSPRAGAVPDRRGDLALGLGERP